MLNKFAKFRSNESGAVTVDWVVLTAAVVLLAVGVGSVLTGDNGITNTLKSKITAAVNGN